MRRMPTRSPGHLSTGVSFPGQPESRVRVEKSGEVEEEAPEKRRRSGTHQPVPTPQR